MMMKLFMQIRILILCMLITYVLPLISYATENDLVILHTNDIHCAVNENLTFAKVAWIKEKMLKENPNVILLDAGDAIQGAPIGRLSQGEAIVNIMNAVGYDFCIPGNHEFDYGMSRFMELSSKMNSGYYCANLINLKTKKHLLEPYKIIDFDGKKIALIGVTIPETLTTSTPTYFQDSQGNYIYSFYEDENGQKLYNRLQECVNTVKKQGIEYVILVGHLGQNNGSQQWSSAAVARNTYGINGIIDGHSHERYNQLVKNKLGEDVLLIQTGSKLTSIGQINITSDGRLKSKLLSTIEGESELVKNVISQEITKYEPILKQNVGKTTVKLYSNDPETNVRLVRKQECNLGDFVADSYKAVLDCDIAIANGGGIRNEIEIGLITYNNLIEAFPFGNMCSVIEVTGKQLLDALEVGAKNYPAESGGFLQVAGLSYTINSQIPSSVIFDVQGGFVKVADEYRVSDVMVGNAPLELEKTYTLGGVDYILRHCGNGMTMFKNCKVVKDAVINDYDAILEYLQNHLNGIIGTEYANPYGSGRIVIK